MYQDNSDYAHRYYPDYYSPPPNPNPNPSPVAAPSADFAQSAPIPATFASAPPYSQYPPPDPSNYPNYISQNPDSPSPNFPQFQSFNPPPPPPPSSFPQQPYYSYEPHQPAVSYAPPANPNPSHTPYYDNNPYESSVGGGGGGYGFGQDFGGDGLGDGVFAYDGGKVEPYGARGTGSFSGGRSSSFGGSLGESGLKFDDYGRSLGTGSSSFKESNVQQPKIVRAVPKMESQQDVRNGVQKFRVKLLPEGASVSTTDVLCQVCDLIMISDLFDSSALIN